MKVDKYVKGAVRQFAYWFAYGTIGSGLLNGIDYVSNLQDESSFAEQVFIVFMNNLEYDETGVTNYKQAEYRAAQYIRSYYNPSYTGKHRAYCGYIDGKIEIRGCGGRYEH